jgi:hypothetical protein
MPSTPVFLVAHKRSSLPLQVFPSISTPFTETFTNSQELEATLGSMIGVDTPVIKGEITGSLSKTTGSESSLTVTFETLNKGLDKVQRN